MGQKNPCKATFWRQCQYVEKLLLDELVYQIPEHDETYEYSNIMGCFVLSKVIILR